MLLSRLGVLHHEAGDLAAAWSCLERGIALSEQLAMDSPIMYSLSFAAPTLYALGRVDDALEALRQAHQHGQQGGLADAGWCLAVEANVRLALGDLAWVQRWADTAGISIDQEPHYLHMDQYLVYARFCLRQGKLPQLRLWLDRLESFAHARGLVRWLLTIHILHATAADREGDSAAAHEHLAQAVRLAAPEDYFQAFLEEDARVLALLLPVRHEAPDFVDRLLGAAAGSPAPVPQTQTAAVGRRGPQPLIEPLSDRELEVLALVAAGLSNREIAGRLFIAVGTVKRHMNNIYGKLHVRRRTEAVARARDLGLL
jgi:LuxR family transcriptional regulator, maltose regulon positive regulatory protein